MGGPPTLPSSSPFPAAFFLGRPFGLTVPASTALAGLAVATIESELD
jgi:hypothetical protein